MDLEVNSFNTNNYAKTKTNRQNVQFGTIMNVEVFVKGAVNPNSKTCENVLGQFWDIATMRKEHSDALRIRQETSKWFPDHKFSERGFTCAWSDEENKWLIFTGKDDKRATRKVFSNMHKNIMTKIYYDFVNQAAKGKKIIINAVDTPSGAQFSNAEFVVNA